MYQQTNKKKEIMKTYAGKEIKKGGKWYPVVIKASSIQEANKKINKNNHSGEDLRGRFQLQEF